MTPAPRTALLALALAFPAAAAPAAETWRVTIEGGHPAPGPTPVVAAIVADVPPGSYTLDDGDGSALPAQVYPLGGQTHLALVLDGRDSESPRTYTLRPAPRDDRRGVRITPEGGDLRVDIDGALFTRYHRDDAPKPYLWPILGPGGVPLTRSFPMETVESETRDHPHQRSFWFTHGDVGGVDFWAEGPGKGTIRERSRRVVDGPAVGVIRTADDWLGPDGRLVCRDARTYRFYNSESPRILDFAVTIQAGDRPLVFGDTKEGSFGLRIASSMDVDRKQGGRITNAEGLHDAEAWGKASPWVDYDGPVDGQTFGIAILNHPESFRYPTTWHVRTYGLFAANPFGWHDFQYRDSGRHELGAGEALTLRYRVLLHEGDTASAHVAEAFEAYAHPPTITVRRADD